MSFKSYKILSLVVAWLNAISSVLCCMYMLLSTSFMGEKTENIGDAGYSVNAAFGICVMLLIWCFMSILLIKGINQQRLMLMSPWVYANIIILFVFGFFLMYKFGSNLILGATLIAAFLDFLKYCAYGGLELVMFYPVYMLYALIYEQRDPDLEKNNSHCSVSV